MAEFHTYVRPTIEKNGLNPFCTELTGITDAQVFDKAAKPIEEVIVDLHKFLEEKGIM